MTSTCNCCGSARAAQLFMNFDRMFYKPGRRFSLSECGDCSLVFVNPVPSQQEISSFYPDNYGSLGKADSTVRKYGRIRDMVYSLHSREDFLGRLQFIALFPLYRIFMNRSLPKPARTGSKLLDVGCGDGDFLSYAKKAGYEVLGVEPFRFNPALSKREGFGIINSTLRAARLESGSFDVITINQVIEHVDDPASVFAEMARIMKPDGRIILATPNTASLGRRIFGKFWYHLDTPRHLFLMNPGIIAKYAEKNSLRVSRIGYSGEYSTYIMSLKYAVEEKLKRQVRIPIVLVLLKIVTMPAALLLSEIANGLSAGDLVEVELSKQKT